MSIRRSHHPYKGTPTHLEGGIRSLIRAAQFRENGSRLWTPEQREAYNLKIMAQEAETAVCYCGKVAMYKSKDLRTGVWAGWCEGHKSGAIKARTI